MLGQAAQATISYLKLPQGNSCFPDAAAAKQSLLRLIPHIIPLHDNGKGYSTKGLKDVRSYKPKLPRPSPATSWLARKPYAGQGDYVR